MRHHFGKVDYFQLGVILIVFISAIIVNAFVGSEVFAAHWNESGQPDLYASKFSVLFLLPIMILFFYLLFLLIPYISRRDEIDEFYENYGGFRLAMILFLAIIYYSLLLSNLGFTLNINYIIIPCFAAVFFYFGHLLSVAKRTHYIGFKNTWTKDSDIVWEKTHLFSGILFKFFSVLSLTSLIFPQYFLFFFVIPLVIIILVIVMYSKSVHKQYVLLQKSPEKESEVSNKSKTLSVETKIEKNSSELIKKKSSKKASRKKKTSVHKKK